MIIQQIHVRHFRSLSDASITMDRLTALVGRNGTGKSSFLRALDLFFSDKASVTVEDFYAEDTSENISIELKFGDLAPEAVGALRGYVHDETLTVRRVFSYAKGRLSSGYYGTCLRHARFTRVREAGGKRDITEAYKKLRAGKGGKYGSLPEVTRGDDALEALACWEAANAGECEPMWDDGRFFGATGAGKGLLEQYIAFIRIPAVRDALQDATEGRGSCVTELLDRVVRGALATREDVVNLEETMRTGYEKLFGSSDVMELREVEVSLTETLRDFAPGGGIGLTWSSLSGPQLPLPKAEVKLSEDGYESAVERAGHGLQRAFILTMLQHLVAASRSIAGDGGVDETVESGVGTPGHNLPTLVLSIEEPELYQHPSRQRHMATVLQDLAEGSIPGVAEETQVIYTTHAPLFVGLDRVDQIRLLRKQTVSEDRPKATTVHATTLDTVAEELWRVSGGKGVQYTRDTLRPRMQVLLTPWMNEGFFADVVVLVEGGGDRAALLAVAESKGHDLESMGVCVVPCGGKNNLDRPAIVFRHLGIPTYIIWDNDRGTREANEEDNRRLLRLVGAEEENWPVGVWSSYACLQGNLEKVLREEISGVLFDELLEEKRCEFGMLRDRAGKNALILREIIESADGQGQASQTLVAIVDQVQEIASRGEGK